MFVTRKHISRRTFLRGSGVAVALPLLESMFPAQTPAARAQAAPKTRFAGIFVPHGAAPGYWVPDKTGTDFKFPFIMEPLEPLRDRTVLLSGLWSKSAEPPPGVTGADHWVASAFLCANKPKKTTGADLENGVTIDQIIAGKIGQETLMPSLQLAVEDPGANSSNCGEGYSCAYTNSISWPAANRPLPMEINPQVVFERLFGDGSTPEARASGRDIHRSILDSIGQSLAGFKKDIGAADRVRLDQYLTDVREIERRLEIAARASTNAPIMDVPHGVPESFDEHIKLQSDLLTLAFQTDITRVATILYARDLTGRTYPQSGSTSSFHGASHHAEDPARIQDFSKINRYHVAMMAYLAEKMRQVPDGDGTLLDHAVILYGTNMGNPNQHLHYDVPHVLVGGASGKLRGGRHLAYPTKTVTTGNLLLSVLDLFDIHNESIGDSTGRLTNL
jgi:hypothetical protein